MVVGRRQIRAVMGMRQDSPQKLCDGLSCMQTCVASHCRGEEALLSHLWGRILRKRFFRVPHRRSS
jgi:hypothetical protein